MYLHVDPAALLMGKGLGNGVFRNRHSIQFSTRTGLMSENFLQ